MTKKLKKTVILVSANTLDRQTRATKIIRSLNNSNFLVTYLCWDRVMKVTRSERKEAGDSFNEIKFVLKAPFGFRSVFFLPFWWCFAFVQLMINKWDAAHICGFHSAPPVIIAGLIKRKSVVYEMIDTFADTMQLSPFLRNFFIHIDKLLMKTSSAVILADEGQIEEVGGIPCKNIVIIYDSPNTIFPIDTHRQINKPFIIFYAGLLNSDKKLNLDKIFMAANDIEDIKIVIAGFGDLVDMIKEWSEKIPQKIDFIGEISHAEVLTRSAKADLLFVLRSPLIIENKYICGSKLLESMMVGTPILVNKGTSTATKVTEEDCGIVVDSNDINEIKCAIIKLRDSPKLCENLGKNALNAHEKRYSWKIMEQRLVTLYQDLIV